MIVYCDRTDSLRYRLHRSSLLSNNPIKHLNGESKRRTNVAGISPNEGTITRLVGAILLEQNVGLAVQCARRMPS